MPAGPAAAERRARGRRGALGRPRAGARPRVNARTVVFFPEGAYGPTNNCVGIGAGAARARPPGRLHRRGVVRRDARGAGLRGAADAARPAARGRGGAGPVLEGLHPRDGARLPEADDRAARGRSSRRPCRRSSTARATSTTACARSSTSSQPDVIVEDNVVAFPALPASGRPWVRIVSCNPLEIERPGAAAGVLRLPGRRPHAAGTSSGADVRRAARAAPAGLLASSASSAARRRCPTATFIHESPHLNLYLYPSEVDYARARAARPHLARPRVVRAQRRRGVRAAASWRTATARSSTSRSARSARPTSS